MKSELLLPDTESYAEDSPDGTGPVIWAVASGKGGVGKSFLVSNLGLALARSGRRAVVVDLDLGGANLHTHLGIRRPNSSLSDFLDGKQSDLNQILEPVGDSGLSLISGATDHLEIANLKYFHKQKIIRHLHRLDADFVILDLGAGTTFNTLDFFNLADQGIMVVVPEPTSIENGYRFLKSALQRRLARLPEDTLSHFNKAVHSDEGGSVPVTPAMIVKSLFKKYPQHARIIREHLQQKQLHMLVNQVREPSDFQLGYSMALVWKHYAGTKPGSLSFLNYDEAVVKGLCEHRQYLSCNPNSRNGVQIRHIARSLSGGGADESV